MLIRMLIIAIATLAFTATAAPAATIYTPRLTSETGGTHTCGVVNVSRKDRAVTIEIISFTGTVLDAIGAFTLIAGRSSFLASTDADRSYCRVIVKGGKKTIRVSLESRLGGDTIAAVSGF